ncbi:hypothetical protein TNCT_1181, partial [Trichonephila clavata]
GISGRANSVAQRYIQDEQLKHVTILTVSLPQSFHAYVPFVSASVRNLNRFGCFLSEDKHILTLDPCHLYDLVAKILTDTKRSSVWTMHLFTYVDVK